MNQGCDAVFAHERAAFALPAGLDRPPPRRLDFADLESRCLDDSLDALDVLGLSAPVLALDAADVTLLAEPADVGTPRGSVCSSSRATPRSKTGCRSGSLASAPPPKPHRLHHSKKASRKQVHELQAMVNAMQMQVDGAAAEIQQLAQLVGQFAHQREREQHEHARVRRRERRQQQLFDKREMDMDLDVQQWHLRAQVEHDREQFEQYYN
ncbi:hypothetical protein PHYPSEUDO_003541 [Phytophthora pseudosyringae]|uniref:Uncharacterized protein n=1 Tax=Phytophthora pseudosyringae TaxID=221518 RepID=A0A8T1VQI0_9STRA|nr:hypothetical protein PHYPSEUDO_003541 [Phytophthora pseudosyringae]